jgi:hypothetical protein
MDHPIAFAGGLLACVAAALAVNLLVRRLQRLAERSGRGGALPLLRPPQAPIFAAARAASVTG